MNSLLILVAAGTVLTIGDLIAGQWVRTQNRKLYILVILFYMIGLNLLVESYRFEDIAVASMLMEIFNVLLLTLAGIYLLKERITRTELAGILLGIVAIVVLEL